MNLRAILATLCTASIVSLAAAQTCQSKATAGATCDKSKATAMATCDKSKGDAHACSGNCGADCCQSPANVARRSIPQMEFVVGKEVTNCPNHASELAKGDSAKIGYRVAEKNYADKMEAGRAYATQLNSYLEDITTVKYAVGEECVSCPMTARSMAQKAKTDVHYRLAAFDFADEKAATAAAEAARKAAEGVKMSMKVGNETTCCAETAKSLAKKNHAKVQYVIGETTTECDVNASVELATAKINAAIDALASATAQKVAANG